MFSSSRNERDTSLHLRQIRSENIEKKVTEIKNKLNEKSSSVLPTNNQLSLFHLLTTKYRRSLFFGILTLFTGSLLLFKYASNKNRNS